MKCERCGLPVSHCHCDDEEWFNNVVAFGVSDVQGSTDEGADENAVWGERE